MANKLPSTSQPESMQLDPLDSGDEVRRDRCLRPNHPGSHSSFVLSDGSVPTFLIFTQAKRLGDSAGLQWLQEGHVLICFFNLRVSSTPTVAKKSGAVLQDNTLKSLARYLGVLFHSCELNLMIIVGSCSYFRTVTETFTLSSVQSQMINLVKK